MTFRSLLATGTVLGTMLVGAPVPTLAVPPPACDLDADGKGDVVINDGIHYGSDIKTDIALNIPYSGDQVFGEGACGDFNGDGTADLAISAFLRVLPTQSCNVPVGGYPNLETVAGVVEVRYGSGAGINAMADRKLWQNSSGVAGSAEACDMFGKALAAGDFDGDDFTDLAVGVPGEGIQGVGDAGLIHVFYGGSTGLTSAGSQIFEQGSPGMPGAREAGDEFGWALAAGDFDGDTFADLAVGIPYENMTAGLDVGMVTILMGTSGGLSTAEATNLHQGVSGVEGANEGGDRYGAVLVTDRWNSDAISDLTVGIPLEAIGGKGSAGKVHVLFGTASGINADGMLSFNQGSPGIPGTVEAGDFFGLPMTSADTDGDGHADLVVGASGDVVGATTRGLVSVLPGSSSGPSGTGAYAFNAGDLGHPNLTFFPQFMIASETDDDAFGDLVVGNAVVPSILISGSFLGLDVAGNTEIGEAPTVRLVG